MNARQSGVVVHWDCPKCGRGNSARYKDLVSVVASRQIVCAGSHFSVGGEKNQCTATVTAGEVLKAIGAPARLSERDPHAALPTGDR